MNGDLSSVPYGGQGYAPSAYAMPGQSGQPGQPGQMMGPPGTSSLAADHDAESMVVGAILIGGLAVLTGGGALVGWLIGHTTKSALIGGLAGLGLSSANLALNAGRISAEGSRP